MRSTCVLHVAGEGISAALSRCLREAGIRSHACASLAVAATLLGRKRSVGVVVVDAREDLASALRFGSTLHQARRDSRLVLLAAPCDLRAAVEGAPRARIVPSPCPDEVLVAAIEAALEEARLQRSARLSAHLAERRRARIAQLEAGLPGRGRSMRMLAEANVRLRQSALGLARLVSVMAERGDSDLASRRERIARTAIALARRLDWPAAEVEDVRMACLLADVGRAWSTADPAAELDGACAERSAQVLSALPFSRAVVAAIRHRHERWDGRGAPDGLKGAEIPRMARLIALAESFVGLVDDEEDPLGQAEAALELRHQAGASQDPALVDALVDMVSEAEGLPVMPELELAGSRS